MSLHLNLAYFTLISPINLLNYDHTQTLQQGQSRQHQFAFF